MVTDETKKLIDIAAEKICGASHVVALVGAGMSAESGIPTYRGSGGIWTKIGEPDPRSFQNFMNDPKLWWERMLNPDLVNEESPERAKFTKALAEAKPNPGHFALVELEKMGKLDTIITQNVDGLHRIAGNNNVAEIHGNRNYYRCLDCSSRFLRDEFTIIDIPPKCPNCQGMIKGDGVMFGEPIPSDVLARCITATQNCDAMLVLGTSGTVYPAASFPTEAYMNGAYIVEINPERTPISDIVTTQIAGATGDILPLLVEKIREMG